MRRLLILLLMLMQSGLVAARAEAGERIALIFGNSDYRNAPRLPNPANDATDVAAAFERLGFSVKLITNGTFDTMRRGLLDFAQQANSADIAAIYFAGHGMEIRDENWLIPTDAELRMDVSASQEAVSLGSIMPIVSRARKLGLVILDACRDNPFSRQLMVSQPGRALATRGLIPVEPPNSVLVAFAAKHGTTADDGAGRNSPFTTALLHNLEIQGLEINYLFRNVHDEVYQATQQRQEPYVYGTLSKEPIYLKAATAVPQPEQAKSANEVALAWSAVKDTLDPADLETFLAQFGNNQFYAALAKNRLNQLKSRSVAMGQPASRIEQSARTEAPSNPESNDLEPADNAILGHWSWRSECPIFGNFHGDMTFTQSETKKLTGINTDAGRGDRREMFDVRLRNEAISFRIKVEGSATQRWSGNLSRRQNGKYLLRGTGTDFSLRDWKLLLGGDEGLGADIFHVGSKADCHFHARPFVLKVLQRPPAGDLIATARAVMASIVDPIIAHLSNNGAPLRSFDAYITGHLGIDLIHRDLR